MQPLVIPTNVINDRNRVRFHYSPVDMYTINILIKPMSTANYQILLSKRKLTTKGLGSMKTDVTSDHTYGI